MEHWFSGKYPTPGIEELWIIHPDKSGTPGLSRLENNRVAEEIVSAWLLIRSSPPGTQLKAWRTIYKRGEEIAPALGVFRFRNSSRLRLFWLASETDPQELLARLTDLLPKLTAYWHALQRRGLFHAAGISHKGRAYLFAGVSGAGKSTVSTMSQAEGDTIIHDDHLVLFKDASRRWVVTDVAYSKDEQPLNGIFFLVQDVQVRLVPLSQVATASRLLEDLKEHGRYILYGDVLGQAFSTCAEIARSIPGFELHFRKSPDFWNLIDEQFID
jgi:hypothetical protein